MNRLLITHFPTSVPDPVTETQTIFGVVLLTVVDTTGVVFTVDGAFVVVVVVFVVLVVVVEAVVVEVVVDVVVDVVVVIDVVVVVGVVGVGFVGVVPTVVLTVVMGSVYWQMYGM